MPRTIECVALLLVLPFSACQTAESSAETPSADATAAQRTTPSVSLLAGAWRLVAIQEVDSDGNTVAFTPQESLFLFTDEYYSMGYSFHESPSPVFAEPWSPTDSEMQERFSSLVVNAGTYELTESEFVLRPEFALWPIVINGEATIEYELVGDELTLVYVNFVGGGGVSYPYYEAGGRYVLRLERVQ
jgi:hypothetical protein